MSARRITRPWTISRCSRLWRITLDWETWARVTWPLPLSVCRLKLWRVDQEDSMWFIWLFRVQESSSSINLHIICSCCPAFPYLFWYITFMTRGNPNGEVVFVAIALFPLDTVSSQSFCFGSSADCRHSFLIRILCRRQRSSLEIFSSYLQNSEKPCSWSLLIVAQWIMF